jgi:hypothetical protein
MVRRSLWRDAAARVTRSLAGKWAELRTESSAALSSKITHSTGEAAVTEERVAALAAMLDNSHRYVQRFVEEMEFVPTGGHRWTRTLQIEMPAAPTATKDWHIVSLGSFSRRRFPDISVSDAAGRRVELVTRKEHGEVLTRAILAGLLREHRANVDAALAEGNSALGALTRSTYRIVTDLRLLFRARSTQEGMPPVVFLPRQGNPLPMLRPEVRVHVDQAERSRLSKIKVRKESPEFFSQVPQFLCEVAVARETAATGRGRSRRLPVLSYEHRLRGWRQLMEDEGRLNLSSDDMFEASQQSNQRILRETRKLLYFVVSDFGNVGEVTERFAIQLWARNPAGTKMNLEMWGSSEKAWLERETILEAAIDHRSDYNSVRAFCSGGVRIEPTSKAGSRWSFSMSAVIYLGEYWRRLPVGVVVLETDAARDRSCLSSLSPERRSDVAELLQQVGILMLSPNVSQDDLLKLLKSLVAREIFDAREAEAELGELLTESMSSHEPVFATRGRATWRNRRTKPSRAARG